jgi:hypothetical protein
MKLLLSLIFLAISSTAFAATSERYGMGGWIQDFQMDTLAFHAISGAAIIDKFGYRQCPRR